MAREGRRLALVLLSNARPAGLDGFDANAHRRVGRLPQRLSPGTSGRPDSARVNTRRGRGAIARVAARSGAADTPTGDPCTPGSSGPGLGPDLTACDVPTRPPCPREPALRPRLTSARREPAWCCPGPVRRPSSARPSPCRFRSRSLSARSLRMPGRCASPRSGLRAARPGRRQQDVGQHYLG